SAKIAIRLPARLIGIPPVDRVPLGSVRYSWWLRLSQPAAAVGVAAAARVGATVAAGGDDVQQVHTKVFLEVPAVAFRAAGLRLLGPGGFHLKLVPAGLAAKGVGRHKRPPSSQQRRRGRALQPQSIQLYQLAIPDGSSRPPQSVTAPFAADDTSLAYLASTPRV